MKYPTLKREDILSILDERFNGSFLSLKDLPDPLSFKDMDRAVKRVIKAINENEKIVLIGDYDVDGVVSTSIMRLFFEAINYPLEWIIPNRFTDGYGLSPTVLNRVDKADLIITVDNGISSIEAAEICTQRGIDLIITDHHIVPDTPPNAYAIVNQKQKDCSFPHSEICGAQIAWYLCAAIRREMNLDVDMRIFLDLTSLAIIADIMPLNHINRAMVESGLKYISKINRPSILAYKERVGKDSFTAEEIAFGLAPILNSAGRMESATKACEYLCSKDIFTARTLLEELIEFNERRKSVEAEITQEALSQVESNSSIIIVSGEDWHEGVLGIVSARLSRLFEKPSIVLSRNGDFYKGSGRSFGDCDLFNLVSSQRALLAKFGGHKAAIGLSIEIGKLEEFKIKLNQEAKSICPSQKYSDPDILGVLPLNMIDKSLYFEIASYEPFGNGNPRPKFIAKDIEIYSIRRMGKNKEHIKFEFLSDNGIIEGVMFRVEEEYEKADKIDFIYTIQLNKFRDRESIQLNIERIIRKSNI